MKREFINLKQGDMTVRQYKTEFERLSSYAPEMVATEEDKCERLMEGLNDRLHNGVSTQEFTRLSSLMEAPEKLEQSLQRSQETRPVSKGHRK